MFSVVLLATFVCALCLAAVYHRLDRGQIVDPSVLVEGARGAIRPKPQERFVFLVLAVFTPLVAFSGGLYFFRAKKWRDLDRSQGIADVLSLGVALAMIAPFVGFGFTKSLYTGVADPVEHTTILLLASMLAAAGWWAFTKSRTTCRGTRFKRVNAIAALIFCSALGIHIAAWRIATERDVTIDPIWHISFDAVLYPLSQVVEGKTILADLPSQYGLFPEMVSPLFRVIGLTVFSFTALCAVLQALSLTAVFSMVVRALRDPMLKVAVGLALVMTTFETVLWIVNVPDRYLQYWPIRFFWPAVSVWAFARYSAFPSVRRSLVVSLFAALGALWNADSGVVIVLAFAAFLVLKWTVLYVGERTTSRVLRKMLVWAFISNISCFGVTVAVALWYLTLKAGAPLHSEWLIEYQRIFYGLGFMMLPMPMQIDPWMSILGIYLMGLLISVAIWARFPRARHPDQICFISFLGLGLFVYYEGRAHVLNLISVSWPAVVLAAILADRTVRAVRAGALPAWNASFYVAALGMLIFCSEPLIWNGPRMWASAIENISSCDVVKDSLVADELDFIRTHSTPHGSCLIVSLRQGIYYASTTLSSPLPGPGFIETILQRDRDAFLKNALAKPIECIFVGIGKASAIDIGADPFRLFSRYSIVATNSRDSMVYLRPK